MSDHSFHEKIFDPRIGLKNERFSRQKRSLNTAL